MTPTPPSSTTWGFGSEADVSGEQVMRMQVPERPRDIATTTTAPSSSSAGMRVRPSKTEWETNKPLIIRLYMDEDLSLKEVMHVMVTEHGMKGTTYDTNMTSLPPFIPTPPRSTITKCELSTQDELFIKRLLDLHENWLHRLSVSLTP